MLFDKHGQGSEELYRLTGTFPAGVPFASICSEVEAASREVASIVGEAVFSAAQAAYDDDDAPEFVDVVRRPIACLAIATYSRLSGVSHGETGRKLKVDDGEKIPFEWMLDRDDREMRERYYRALDTLLDYLDAHPESGWEGKKMTAGCIVKSVREFEAVYPLEHSHYMFARMVPVMLEAQSRLRNIIGKERLSELLSNPDAQTAPLARRYVILLSLTFAIERWSLDAFPLAVARRFSPSYQGNRESRAAQTEEIDWYLEKLHKRIRETVQELRTETAGNPWESARLLPDNDPSHKYFTV